MKITRLYLAISAILVLFALVAIGQAQEIVPVPGQEFEDEAYISWPPPVYTLRGEIELRGTANLPNMSNYFVEFRPLLFEIDEQGQQTNDDEEEENPWFPITLPSTERVEDDVLGLWNTETAPDGLYEIRLTVNIANRPAQFFVVRPLRIENEPPEFLDGQLVLATPLPPVNNPTSTPRARPTLAPSPTAIDTTPRVVALVNANVRAGDSTNYETVDTLFSGQRARIVGISAGASGWYFIELNDGNRGWIAPSVVDITGDLRGVPRINPPATPTPTATNTPVPAGNLTGAPPALNPNPPVCNQEFQVLANITNTGDARTTAPVTVAIQDIHVATGQVQATFIEVVPELDPGANYVVGNSARFNISTFFDEEHRIVITIDTDNVLAETNEDDNVLSATYILQRGDCG